MYRQRVQSYSAIYLRIRMRGNITITTTICAPSLMMQACAFQCISAGSIIATTTHSTSMRLHRVQRASKYALPPPACLAPVLINTKRKISYVVNSASFEVDVIQSQQAICLVYCIPNSNCTSFLRTAEMLVDKMNAEVSGAEETEAESEKRSPHDTPACETGEGKEEEELVIEVNPSEGGGGIVMDRTGISAQDSKSKGKRHSNTWIKLCTINADENRNLASAFSVERAKLPITYFIMQGTIVDKVVGHITETRLQGILLKFLEHYQKEMNVDLLARRNKQKAAEGSAASPLPSAAAADLIGGASTSFLQNKVMEALVGPEMIHLPEEAPQLDGIRRTLQEAKKKAHMELMELYHQLGMDTRKLPEASLHAHYYKSPQFHALGLLSALETLYLARTFAALGDVAKQNVEWAKRAVQRDYAPVIGDPALRRVLALVDANIVKGNLRTAANLASRDTNRISGVLAAMDEDAHNNAAGTAMTDEKKSELQAMVNLMNEEQMYIARTLRIIDENVDTRVYEDAFPSAVVEELFSDLKEQMRVAKASRGNSGSALASSGKEEDSNAESNVLTLDSSMKRSKIAQERADNIKMVLMCILQLYASDPACQAARSRLSSLLH